MRNLSKVLLVILGLVFLGGCGGGGGGGGGSETTAELEIYTIHASTATLKDLKSDYESYGFRYIEVIAELYSSDVKPTTGTIVVPGPVATETWNDGVVKKYLGNSNTLTLSTRAEYPNENPPYVAYSAKNEDVNDFVSFINSGGDDIDTESTESSFHRKNLRITVGPSVLEQPLNFRSTKEQVETDKIVPYVELVTDADGYVTGGRGKLINLETGLTPNKGGVGAKDFRRFQDFKIREKGKSNYINMNFKQSGSDRWYPDNGASLEFDVEYVDSAEKIKAEDVDRAEVSYRVSADPAHPKVQEFLYRWTFNNN